MRPLTNDCLLEAWDRGSGQTPLGRALTMLAFAAPERESAEFAALSIPERNLELLRLRRLTFGDALRGFHACERCGASLEFEEGVSSLLDRLDAGGESAAAEWTIGNFICTMRPANSEDLAAAAAASELRVARRTLLERCTTWRREGARNGQTGPDAAEF